MLKQAMKDIRVLDLSRILAGPWCTQNLADLGADVIKIEHPGSGDDTRGWGPPFLEIPGGDDRFSAYFLACNRGKRSIAIDFAKPEGAALVQRLAAQADVVIENFRSGTLAKYGLDYASLNALNPRLVYLSITGFGQDGPMAGKPGYDYVFQGFGGLMSYTGHRDDEPGAGPLRAGASVIDLSTGMYASVAVLGALLMRAQTGTGQHIDLALADVAVAINANQNLNYLVSGRPPVRTGNSHPNLAPYEVFACADGHLILAIGNDAQFTRFCALAECPELARDARFVTNAQRLDHLVELRREVAHRLSRRTRAEWQKRFDAAGIPWGPINTLDQVFDDPQTKHRQLRQTLLHPAAGEIPTVCNPLARSAALETRAPPLLGEHTREVLATLNLDDAAIAQLEASGVVRTH
ncbi:CaiB/BaiF CoA transferase family protein [Paraburkholderia oxyphila]|uniref:CaiB/BaiF CoA transferase family protein n=1 Tax=Paraburkholderia oxyphila TaxID=614212 RepID=UPI0004889BC5|nr:CaiB/BaiF CoA-transferase family protein [Paraburkholderia oxyphila]